MNPEQSHELAVAVARLYGLALSHGLSVEVRLGGDGAPSLLPMPGSHCGCGACRDCLAEAAAPEARRDVLLKALRLAWRAHPGASLGKILGEAHDWLAAGRFESASDIEILEAFEKILNGAP